MIFQEPMTAPQSDTSNRSSDDGRNPPSSTNRIVGKLELKRLPCWKRCKPDAVEVMSRYPFELSGGMRQRVMIALAFSCEPQLIIADEPTTALDVTVQLQVLRLLKHKARASGTAVLFISHDMAVVSQLCDSVYVMYAGSVIEDGVTADVIHHPGIRIPLVLLQCAPEHGYHASYYPPFRGRYQTSPICLTAALFAIVCYAAGAQCENVLALTACGDNNQRCACWYPQQEVISV